MWPKLSGSFTVKAKGETEGKTEEAKADLARLKLIREKREAEAARRLQYVVARGDCSGLRKSSSTAVAYSLGALWVSKSKRTSLATGTARGWTGVG